MSDAMPDEDWLDPEFDPPDESVVVSYPSSEGDEDEEDEADGDL